MSDEWDDGPFVSAEVSVYDLLLKQWRSSEVCDVLIKATAFENASIRCSEW